MNFIIRIPNAVEAKLFIGKQQIKMNKETNDLFKYKLKVE